MEVIIRPARPEDVAVLRRFEQGVVDAERPFDPSLRDGRVQYYDVDALIAADDVRFVVAEIDGASIGCGFARIEPAKSYLRHRAQAYLGLMYVEPHYRGQAVSAKILAALQVWCRARDVHELRLEVYQGNRGAISAYRKAGFTEHMLEMRLTLTDE